MSQTQQEKREGVRVRFSSDEVDFNLVLEAEQALREAGVQFDTGFAVDDEPAMRDWWLDGIGSGYEVEVR